MKISFKSVPGANGIQSNSWSNSAHKSVALNAGLIQKDAVARGSSQSDSASSRKVNLPRILVNSEGASVSLAGVKPARHFFAKMRSSERTKFLRYAGAHHENFRKSDGSEFCILNVVSRTEVVGQRHAAANPNAKEPAGTREAGRD